MRMTIGENGDYTRCCNFLVEMFLKYITNGEEDKNLEANKKEGGEFFPTFFVYIMMRLCYTLGDEKIKKGRVHTWQERKKLSCVRELRFTLTPAFQP